MCTIPIVSADRFITFTGSQGVHVILVFSSDCIHAPNLFSGFSDFCITYLS